MAYVSQPLRQAVQTPYAFDLMRRWSGWHIRCRLFGSGLQQQGDQSAPTGLVGGADAAAGLAVIILVEQHEILRLWIGL